MRKKDVEHAIAEAEKFRGRAAEYLKRISTESETRQRLGGVPTKEGSALRRTSLDLTRALADMRNPK